MNVMKSLPQEDINQLARAILEGCKKFYSQPGNREKMQTYTGKTFQEWKAWKAQQGTTKV